MFKKFVSMVVALVMVIMTLPGAMVSLAATEDYFAYGFNDYAGQGFFLPAGAEGTLTTNWYLNLESANGMARQKTDLGAVGGKAATDLALVYKVTATETDKSGFIGPWENGDKKPQSMHWSYFSSSKPYVTYQWDVYDTTTNGSFTVFGRENPNASGKNHYTFDGITVSKNKWHTIAAEFIYVAEKSNSCNIYVDGKKVAAYTGINYDYPRYCYLYFNAAAADTGIMAIDNMRVYGAKYEGATEVYSNNFDASMAWSYDKFELNAGKSTRGSAKGIMGKASDDQSLTYTFGADVTESSSPNVSYRKDISKLEGTVTYEISYRDTTSKSYHRIYPCYTGTDGNTKWAEGYYLEFIYADNGFGFAIGGEQLKDENGAAITKKRDSYWHELAVTMDTVGDRVTYYIDGDKLYEKSVEIPSTTDYFQWDVTHNGNDAGVISFDDFRVYKGEYYAEDNKAAITSLNANKVKTNDTTLNVFSTESITLSDLKQYISSTDEVVLYDNLDAVVSGTVSSTETLSDGMVLVVKSPNGEQFAYYTVNVVNSDSSVSLGTPVVAYDDSAEVETLKATVDVINYGDEALPLGLYLVIYNPNHEVKCVSKLDVVEKSVSGEQTLTASVEVSDDDYNDNGELELAVFYWNSDTLEPITTPLTFANVEGGI